MRIFVLLPVLVCFGAAAQNWALLNPAYKYNYSNDGTDTISNQIFVTHIDTLGVDSFRYELDRVGVVEDNTNSNYFSQCENLINPLLARSGQMQLGMGSVLRGTMQWALEGQDTLTVFPNATLSSAWTNSDGSSVSVVAVDTGTILGILDSIKWIGSSSGDTLLLSKDHGIVHRGPMSTVGPAPTLIGMGGAVESGAQFPSHKSLFDYSVGDILQYGEGSEYVGGDDCVHYSQCTVKYRTLSRTDLTGRTEYTMRAIHACDYWANYVWDWTPCGSGSEHWIDTVFVGVDHDRWSADNPFCSLWRMETYPGALSPMEWMGGITRALVVAELDSAQHYLLSSATLLGPGSPYSLLCPNDQDTSVWLTTSVSNFSTTFLDRVGLTFEQTYDFESGGSRGLLGYLINGEQSGTLTPDGVLLGMAKPGFAGHFVISPNPCTDHITIDTPQASGRFRILDAAGRLVLSGAVRSPHTVIPIDALIEGVYVLTMDQAKPQRFIVAR